MSTTSRRLILGFALVGLGFAGASAWVHYKLLTDASYSSPCDLSATFNCTQVYLSRFGAVAGVPVALGGVIWFALVALVAGAAGRPADVKNDPSGAYVFALSTVGLASVLYLGYASFVVLKLACVLCIGTYVAVAGIFVTSGLAASVSVTGLPKRLGRDLSTIVSQPTALLIALLFLAGTASLVAFFPKEGTRPPSPPATQDQAKQFEDIWWQQPRVDLGIPADGAKVIVVKFNDYQCPGCRTTHEWYKPVLAKFQKSHPGAVKFVLKDWPWSAKCNFNVPGEMHAAACDAAAAARLARDRGKFDEMETWLFANQATLSSQSIVDAVKQLLGVTDFAREYATRLADIRRDIADGAALSIDTTPTLFINGVRIARGLMPAELFELAITLELNKK